MAGLLAGHAMAAPDVICPTVLPDNCHQMLLVTTSDWSTINGTMRRFTRTNAQSSWTEVGQAIPLVVGRSGLAWGRGLPLTNRPAGPGKMEGDGKSPAGIFRLSSAFGLAEPDKMKNVRLPYRQLTDEIECVDDVKSEHYNTIVDRGQTAKVDWNSSEKMRAIGEQYRLGIVVEHNTDAHLPGVGSCIFIHIWKNAETGTSGCTAMAPEQMEIVLPWLNPADDPVLVQLPEPVFESMAPALRLPPVEKLKK